MNNDKDAYDEAFAEYMRYLNKIDDAIVDVSKCADVKPATLVGLSTVERLRKPELDPRCPEHALMMMSPSFTMNDLRSQGGKLYAQAFRKMMQEVHPDKAGKSKEIEEAAVRLNAARATLQKVVG